MDSQQLTHPFDSLEPVALPEEVTALQEESRKIYVDPLVKQYIVSLVEGSRRHRDVALGASPRASLALQRPAQALALLRGRDYVLPDDVKALAGAGDAVIEYYRRVMAPYEDEKMEEHGDVFGQRRKAEK